MGNNERDRQSQHNLEERTHSYFEASRQQIFKRTDTFFSFLMVAQWIGGILVALFLSSKHLSESGNNFYDHIYAAIFLGGIICLVPAYLAWFHPGLTSTRQIISIAQMLMSGLLIHLTGGRIETHFHVFGSLALLGFYRDWAVFPSAICVTVADHFIRGIAFPASVFGVAYASPWRSAEYAVWVLFEAGFLIWSCIGSRNDLWHVARKQCELEALNEEIELRVEERSRDLFEAREEFKETEERIATMQAIIRQAADAIIIFDEERIITSVNAKAEELFGYSDWELIGNSFDLLLQDQSKETVGAMLDASIDTGSDRSQNSYHELRARRKSGDVFSIEAAVSSVLYGAEPAYTIIVRDLTQRQLLEIQLRQAQKLESIGQLAAGIAHEINTPIQFVGDNTRFFKDEFSNLRSVLESCNHLVEATRSGGDAEPIIKEIVETTEQLDTTYLCGEIPKALEQSLEGIARVTRIVRAMKEFSHPGSTQKQSIDINRAIESTIVVSTNEWKYVADVEMDFDRSLPLVPCLPGEFNQVVLNLLVNSAHAIADSNGAQESHKGKISVLTRNLGDKVEIRIEDTGGGIPDSIAQKIFDPFFTTKEVGRGTGQGLAIARSIVVNKHGGSIEFESEIGTGTTFIICLPLQEAAVQ